MVVVLRVLEVVGLLAFGLSGALLAVRKGFDVVGVLLLAALTAGGGGVLRDLVLGRTPPAAFTDVAYGLAPLAAAALAFAASERLERLGRAVVLFDAVGLGVFCVGGTQVALAAGLGGVPAALLGVTTGVGGGLLRDVVARETPLLLSTGSNLYAIPALCGAGLVVARDELPVPGPVVLGVAAALVVVLRLLSVARGWHAPLPRAVVRRRRASP